MSLSGNDKYVTTDLGAATLIQGNFFYEPWVNGKVPGNFRLSQTSQVWCHQFVGCS